MTTNHFNSPGNIVFDEETIRRLFGHEAAEDEDIRRLKQYYVRSDLYDCMRSNINMFVLVGHKGVGKSALLKVLASEDYDLDIISINIQPDDILSLNLDSIDFLQKIRDWKEGLSRIILRRLISNIIQQDPKKKWEPLLSSLTSSISSILGRAVSSLAKEYSDLTPEEILQVFNENGVLRHKVVTVYMDDLDRGWKASKNDIENISAMLNAIRDIAREVKNIRFRIALRSDVYYAYKTSDESTDKVDGSVLWQKWTNHEILVMLIKRLESFWGRNIDEKRLLCMEQQRLNGLLKGVFEPTFHGVGKWKEVSIYRILMSMTRKRPRDLVKLCTLAARNAFQTGKPIICGENLQRVFLNYSNDRLTDVSNEYRSELPQVKELLLKMKPSKREFESQSPCIYPRDVLITKLKDIKSMSNLTFSNGTIPTADELGAFLFKINFITARQDTAHGIQRIYYDENRYIYNEFVDFGYKYEIHPAYRWALQPDRLDDLYRQITLDE